MLRQQVPKNHCACVGGRTNIVFVRLPCDARRMAAAPNSHVHVLKQSALSPPLGCASTRAIRGARPSGRLRRSIRQSCRISRHRQRRRGTCLGRRPSMALFGARSDGLRRPGVLQRRSETRGLASTEAMDGRQRSDHRAVACRQASQCPAGARRACSRPRKAEFAPARWAREAQGSFGNTTLPKPACPTQWLWLLSPKGKQLRSRSERNRVA